MEIKNSWLTKQTFFGPKCIYAKNETTGEYEHYTTTCAIATSLFKRLVVSCILGAAFSVTVLFPLYCCLVVLGVPNTFDIPRDIVADGVALVITMTSIFVGGWLLAYLMIRYEEWLDTPTSTPRFKTLNVITGSVSDWFGKVCKRVTIKN